MRLTTRSRYGTRILVDIATHQDQGPVQVGQICSRQGISVKYAELLIRDLKKAGYITSVRGAKGGHLLARSQEDITVGEVVEFLDGQIHLSACEDKESVCRNYPFCPTRSLWQEVEDMIQKKLYSVHIADLMPET